MIPRVEKLKSVLDQARRNVCLILWATLLSVTATAAEFETPPERSAMDLLPPALLSGPNYRVDSRVRNDGFMNYYTIDSDFGRFDASSDAALRLRLQEINALATMQELMGSDEFIEAAKQAGLGIVEGAKNIVTQPLDTLGRAASGVGRLFQRAGDSMFGDPASQHEDSALENLVGIAKKKRDYAIKFGVDPYTDNAVLQTKLDELAQVGFAGGLTTSMLTMMIPGGFGAAVSVSGGSDLLSEVLRTKPPTDLRRMNRANLQQMGVAASVIDLFMTNTHYPPSYQTALVEALGLMNDAAERTIFIQTAALAKDRDMAFFRQRQARMYAEYHNKTLPIERFLELGGLTAGLDRQGQLVVCAPVDYLVWTETLARFVAGAEAHLKDRPEIAAKQLLVSGRVSPASRTALQKAGWSLSESVAVASPLAEQ